MSGRILLGVVIVVFYIWVLIESDFNQVINEYRIIDGRKNTVSGQIISAEEFSQEVEKNDGRRIDMVHGYTYTYTFQTTNHENIVAEGWTYGNLPSEKNRDNIPYEVEVEYAVNDPELNRIKGLSSNVTSIYEWFKQYVLLKLIGFVFCIYVSFRLIKGAVEKYKMENE